MSYYKYVSDLYKGIKNDYSSPDKTQLRDMIVGRKKEWRNSPPVVRVEKPTRIDRARQYGYKAKQGFVIARVRLKRGGRHKTRPVKGRRPKRAGVSKLTAAKSIQRISEEKAQRKFMNLEVLGSYWLWEDGQYKFYEVVLVDPSHPQIINDKDINWVCKPHQKNRAMRGLTPAGKKGRGQQKRGKGREKVRPSLRAKGRKAK